MFGKRKVPFDPQRPAPPPPPPPPPPPSGGWLPAEKMNGALEAAIRLFTQALTQAGQAAGGLGLAAAPPAGVAALLADCIVYPGEESEEFLTLGITADFKAFSYQPHCRL